MKELIKPANFQDKRERLNNWMDKRQSLGTSIRSGDLTEDELAGAEKVLKDLNITPIQKRKSDDTGTDSN